MLFRSGIYLVIQNGDEDGVWIPVHDAGRSEFIGLVPIMPLKVVAAEARLNRRNMPAIHLALSDDLVTTFAEVTRRFEGSRLALVAGGSVVAVTRINEPILDGRPCIAVGGDISGALQQATRLRLASATVASRE